MYTSKVELEQHLLRTETILRNANTPKPYELNLIVDFYYAVDKEYWKEYIETHPDVIVIFFDNDTCYSLKDDSKLVIKTTSN
jgi:hypothetical protein